MKKRTAIIVTIIILCLTYAAALSGGVGGASVEGSQSVDREGVERVVIEEDDVVCYKDIHEEAISCLPVSEANISTNS